MTLERITKDKLVADNNILISDQEADEDFYASSSDHDMCRPMGDEDMLADNMIEEGYLFDEEEEEMLEEGLCVQEG
jgi:hypothetical protein